MRHSGRSPKYANENIHYINGTRDYLRGPDGDGAGDWWERGYTFVFPGKSFNNLWCLMEMYGAAAQQ